MAADYRSTVLGDAPQGFWRLGETLATTATDASGNGYHGTYSGATVGVAGAVLRDSDTAARFVAGTYVDLSGGDAGRFAFSGRAAFSVEAWVRPSVVDTGFRYQVHKGTSPDRWNLELSSQYGFAFSRVVAGSVVAATQSALFPPVAGRWYHLVGTYDGSTTRLYVNGVQTASRTDERSLPAIASRAEIGSDAVSDMDEVAIYPAALSPERVLAHYRAGTGELGKRSYARFESFSLNASTDLSVNVANGNLLVETDDLRLAGTGLDLTIGRSYNGLSSDTGGLPGLGWSLNTGSDVKLAGGQNGSMTFLGPSGYRATFVKQPDGTFTSPAGVNAKLTLNANGSYTLRWNSSDERYEFGSNGLLNTVVDRNGNDLLFGRNTDYRTSQIVDTRNRTTTFGYDANALLTSVSDGTRTLSYAYDAAKRLSSYTDAAGGVSQYSYDSSSRLTKIVTPAGRETRIGYDAQGRVATVTRVTNATLGTGPVTSFAYPGSQTDVTDARGNKTTYFVEDPGRVSSIKNALGRSVATTYTSNSNVQTYTAASGASGRNDYSTDGRENMLQSTSPTGSVRKWEYDAAVYPYQPKSSTDEQGAVYDYSYDSVGRLTQIKLRATNQVVASYAYNADGTMASYTDARGKITSYSYNTLGQRTQTSYPAPLGAESYSYDSLGRLLTVTDGKGQVRSYSYDSLDRVTQIAYPGSSVTYGYDADGNQTSQADGFATITRSYDAENQILTETRPLGVTSYSWDSVGNLVTLADIGGTVSYGYDQLNLPTSVTEPGNKLTTIAYNMDDQPVSTTFPNGVVTTRTYDPASGRLTEIESLKGTRLAYSKYTYTTITPAGETQRDAALVKTVLDEAGNTTSYGYDPGQGFLTSAVKRNGANQVVSGYDYSYSYDLMGNRISETVNGTTTGSIFNDANQLVSRGSTSYSYDLDGNLLSSSAGAAYVYNPKNQSSSLKQAGGTAQSQVYAGASQFERLEKDNGTGTYTQFGESILGTAIRKQGTATYYTRLPNGEILSQRTPSGSHYYLKDGLGTIVALTDANGAVIGRYSYDPYGKTLTETAGMPYNPWRFKGGYQSQTTGLYKFGQRWYDPAVGRWTQADPLEQPTSPGDWNRYAYVAADPINTSDPSGLFSLDGALAWGVTAGAGLAGGAIGGALCGPACAIAGAALAAGAAGTLSSRYIAGTSWRRAGQTGIESAIGAATRTRLNQQYPSLRTGRIITRAGRFLYGK